MAAARKPAKCCVLLPLLLDATIAALLVLPCQHVVLVEGATPTARNVAHADELFEAARKLM